MNAWKTKQDIANTVLESEKMKTRAFTAYGDDEGNGTLQWSEAFLDEAPIYRADILQEILQKVADAYNEAVADMRKQLDKPHQ